MHWFWLEIFQNVTLIHFLKVTSTWVLGSLPVCAAWHSWSVSAGRWWGTARNEEWPPAAVEGRSGDRWRRWERERNRSEKTLRAPLQEVNPLIFSLENTLILMNLLVSMSWRSLLIVFGGGHSACVNVLRDTCVFWNILWPVPCEGCSGRKVTGEVCFGHSTSNEVIFGLHRQLKEAFAAEETELSDSRTARLTCLIMLQ